MNKKVVLGMSGGVDSSAAAHMLLEQGYEVHGLVVKVWREKGSDGFETMLKDIEKVCNTLDIKCEIADYTEEFKNKVVEYFINEYENGRTPNPCYMCNPGIKFKALIDYADKIGADYIATGHYAKLIYDENTDKMLIYRSVANKKDQTYFLAGLDQSVLKRCIMPLGDYDKEYVRKYALDNNLAVANKPDSQEICFLDDNDYKAFIQRYTNTSPIPGKFLDTYGNIIGQHTGIINYTYGQRKGLGMSFGKPMFVKQIDAKNNSVVLGEAGEEFSREFYVNNLNWICINPPDKQISVLAKARYAAPAMPAVVELIDNNRAKVTFNEPVRSPTPGQAAVFYDGDLMLGGGIIE